jgi:hypothetical protein
MPQSEIGFGMANRGQKGPDNGDVVPPLREKGLM